jgi:hypothetical protein
MKDRQNWEIFCFGEAAAKARVASDNYSDSSEEFSTNDDESQVSATDLSIRKDRLFQQLDSENNGKSYEIISVFLNR